MINVQIKDKHDFLEKFKYPLFECYKQGFLFSNFINESLIYDPDQVKGAIIDDFTWFFEKNGSQLISKLKDGEDVPSKTELQLTDLILGEGEENQLELSKLDELLATCPACGKKIYPTDIDLKKINFSEITNFPFPYLHIHSQENCIPHALLMYIDRHFKVRGRKVIKFLNVE
ncbi:MAG: hypothetical protein EU541_02895 [Promethearchaeota archaeon]|nr:MAG: hypothetical protein EU541_02895 [Candidatus Lokiarchaeota archaeon]